MANAVSANVLVIDTTADFDFPMQICGIQYEAGSSGTPAVTIKAPDTNGAIVYYKDGSSDTFDQVKIKAPQGVHITVAGTGTVVRIYLA
jgi:hypothetical protein